jgi:hypothetical protein
MHDVIRTKVDLPREPIDAQRVAASHLTPCDRAARSTEDILGARLAPPRVIHLLPEMATAQVPSSPRSQQDGDEQAAEQER